MTLFSGLELPFASERSELFHIKQMHKPKNLYIIYRKNVQWYEVHVIIQNVPFVISVITCFGTDNCRGI